MSNAWMIRSGKGSSLLDDFCKGYIGIGWHELGDMSAIGAQEHIRRHFEKIYPDKRPGTIRNQVTVFYKFRTVMQKRDTIITFDNKKKEYLIGTVTGDYMYDPDLIACCSHIRRTKWQMRIKKDDLSTESKNSLGSNLTLFNLKEKVISDLQAIIEAGKTLPLQPAT